MRQPSLERESQEGMDLKWKVSKLILVGVVALVALMVVGGWPSKPGMVVHKQWSAQVISDDICSKCKLLPKNEQAICAKDCVKRSQKAKNCASCKANCIGHGKTNATCARSCKIVCAISLSSDIVGGSPAIAHEYPSMVSLQRKDFNNLHWCGGTLLNSESVLTAAHCCFGMHAFQFRAVLGEHHLGEQDPAHEQIRDVSELIMHPSFTLEIFAPDVCVVHLSSAITFTAQVSFVNLAPQGQAAPPEGTVATVIGWGRLSSNGPSPQFLHEVDVGIKTDADCRAAYGTSLITNDMICATKPGKDACQGDSGGPLFRKSDMVQIGVVSWGFGCAHPSYPGVYAEVSHHTDWINAHKKGTH